MSIIRRAWWGVSRRRNQSLILLVILITVGTLVIASLSIQAATKKAEQDARKTLGSEVILKAYNKAGSRMIENIPFSMAESLSVNQYVDDYIYTSNWYYIADNFEVIPGVFDDVRSREVEITVDGKPVDNVDEFNLPELNVIAITNTSKLREFSSGVYTLEEGHHITEASGSQSIVLIEKRLAETNGLHTGDKIKMTMFGGLQTEVEVIGVYSTKETPDDVQIKMNRPFVQEIDMPYNKMFMPFEALSVREPDDIVMSEAIYYVDDPMHVPLFKADVSSLFDPDKFRLNSNEDKLNKMSFMINQVASLSSMMLWLVMLCGAVILSLLFIYFVKGRMREMGVLLSLGENRFKLLLQLMIETMIIIMIAFSLSVFSGTIVAKQAGDVLLEQRQAAYQEDRQLQLQGADMFRIPEGQEEFINTLHITLSHDIWIRLIYVTGLILLVSILIPAVLVLRLKPRTILTLQE